MSDVTPKQVDDFLLVLKVLTPKQRTFLLKTLNKKQMSIIEVACFNLATNNNQLDSKQIALLRRYKRQIELIASKNFNLGEKRAAVQKGGFISAVLPILGTLISSFL